MSKTWHKIGFRLREILRDRWLGGLRILYWKAWGMRIGNNSRLRPVVVTWPHQVSIGNDCMVEQGCIFKFDGIWQPGPSIRLGNHVFVGAGTEFNIKHGISIGDDALIASGCRFVDHDHGMQLDQPMRMQQCAEAPISIGNDVWIGANVVVLRGVEIGDGAVVGAGAVVRESIPPRAIAAGVPARVIRMRE